MHEEESEERPSPTPISVQTVTVNMSNETTLPTFETVSVTPITILSPAPTTKDLNNQSNSGSYTQKPISSRYLNYSFESIVK